MFMYTVVYVVYDCVNLPCLTLCLYLMELLTRLCRSTRSTPPPPMSALASRPPAWLRWALEHGCPWSEETCARAAQSGHLEVLRWAREHNYPWDAGWCADIADEEGHVEVARWVGAQATYRDVDPSKRKQMIKRLPVPRARSECD